MLVYDNDWIVSVTYGTQAFAIYANVPARESAETLVESAREHGYHDARVYRGDEFKKAADAHFHRRFVEAMDRRSRYLGREPKVRDTTTSR